jgi:hypothetical protein
MKKTIAFLIESELEQAEVILAARSISDALQKMTENAAKMEAEDLMPLVDPIREHFGPEASSQFSDAVTEKLRHLVEVLSETKNAVSDEIARLQGEDVAPTNDLSTMDSEMDSEGDESSEEAEPAEDDTFDFDDMDFEDEAEDTGNSEKPKFSDEELPVQNAAGRVRKESVELSGDRAIMREYAGLIREGQEAKTAAKIITETYGIDFSTLLQIVESAKR